MHCWSIIAHRRKSFSSGSTIMQYGKVCDKGRNREREFGFDDGNIVIRGQCWFIYFDLLVFSRTPRRDEFSFIVTYIVRVLMRTRTRTQTHYYNISRTHRRFQLEKNTLLIYSFRRQAVVFTTPLLFSTFCREIIKY